MQLFMKKRNYPAALWGYMLLVAGIILFISIFVFNYFYGSSTQKTIEKNTLSIKLMKQEIDNQIQFMDDTTQGLKGDYELLLAIMENNGYSDYKLATKLANYTTVNPNILDIVIFDYRQNRAFCSSGMVEAEQYFDFYVRTAVSPSELNRQVRQTGNTTITGFFQVNMHKYPDMKDVAFYITPISNTRKLVYIINKDMFYRPVETIIGNLQGTFHILDSSGNSLLSFNINSDKEFPVDFGSYTEDRATNGISIGSLGKHMAVSSKSDVSRFQYCIVSDPSFFMKELNIMQTVLLASLAGLFVIGLASSYVFASMSYEPIKRLKSFLSSDSHAVTTTGYDDLDSIKDQIYEIREKLREASQRLSSDKDFVWNSLINALVSSTSIYYINQENYTEEGILFPYEAFAVLAAKPSDKGVFRQLRRWENGHAIGYVSDKNDFGLLIAIFNAENETILKEAISQFSMEIRQSDRHCSFGIGDSIKGTYHIRQSFLQALSALNAVQGSTDVMRHDPGIQTFIHQLDSLNLLKPRLAHAIRTGDMEEVETLIRSLFENTKDRTQHILMYSDLISQLIMTAYSVNLYDDEMNNALYYIYSDSQNMIKGYLFFAHRLSDYIKKTKNSKSTQLLKDIKAYIAENFADKNLSVQSISEHFNVSISYLNKYMKEMGNETVFGILDTVRMEHAKRMLLEDDLPVKEVVDRCGYGDTSHFIKKFKKQFGLTPTQYRMSYTGKGTSSESG